ncbi:MAG: metallophosphoesterase [Verrucomicrobiae bacterium]|nr:metallophosphoesterase [Verrucomicrobiae bacterium]
MIPPSEPNRRTFLHKGCLWLAGSACIPSLARAAETGPLLRIGLVTDLHYADKDPKGTRHYRETLAKLEEAGEFFRRHQPAFVAELGDFIDAADSVETELGYLKRIQASFEKIARERHHVLGNHCVDTLTKEEFLGGVGQERSWYSFDREGVHFVVLDSCFRSDGTPYQRKNFDWKDANLPADELEWLRGDLADATGPVIVFAHQRLDRDDVHTVRNAPAARGILEQSGKVSAVFQGHSHQNDLVDLGGIHYVTLRAMVEGTGLENNGYSLLEVHKDGSLKLLPGRLQQAYEW